MKRFVSLILSVCFLFSINTVSYAANISSRKASNPVIQSMNDKYHVDFSGMSIDELNKFIDKMKDEAQTRASGNLLNNTQLAWLAAAQIARDKGYECAALMVEFSVYNIDYSESVTDSSTPLLDKLNTTTVFNNYKNKVLNSGLKDFSGGSWSFTIQKSDNADLFYQILLCSLCSLLQTFLCAWQILFLKDSCAFLPHLLPHLFPDGASGR